jgi:hypothetical protein
MIGHHRLQPVVLQLHSYPTDLSESCDTPEGDAIQWACMSCCS